MITMFVSCKDRQKSIREVESIMTDSILSYLEKDCRNRFDNVTMKPCILLKSAPIIIKGQLKNSGKTDMEKLADILKDKAFNHALADYCIEMATLKDDYGKRKRSAILLTTSIEKAKRLEDAIKANKEKKPITYRMYAVYQIETSGTYHGHPVDDDASLKDALFLDYNTEKDSIENIVNIYISK